MIARVTVSNDVAFTLSYGQNPEKGGEVFYLNETLSGISPKEMADDWLAIANEYSPMCYHIVISMSRNDTLKIRNIDNPASRVEFEQNVIRAFMEELSARGNNVYDCPFVVAHHENTDCDHFHIALLTTTVDGRRLKDSFIKKNACRAAAKISEEYGLEAADKALYLEKQHQKAVGRHKGESTSATLADKRKARKDKRTKRGYTRVEKDPKEMKERQRRNLKAQQRKQSCKYMIEKTAKDKNTNAGNFISRLATEGIHLYFDPYEICLYAEIHDDDDDKKRTYSLDKELGVDMSLLQRLNVNTSIKERVDKAGTKKYQALKAKVEKERKASEVKTFIRQRTVKGKSVTHPGRNARVTSAGRGLGSVLSAGGGSHGGQTQQGNVNPDGRSNSDDLDEEWRRKNGYSY